VPLDEARLGGIGFDEWLRRRSQAASACSRVMSPFGTSRTSGDVRPESAKWAKADTDQVPVTNAIL
jgi:hypothetical protein